jgi:cystathionine gamma-synthase
MSSSFEDIYFDEDAIYMERNSRDFEGRIGVIDSNTEAVCDFLRSRSVVGGGGANSVIKEVIYPKWTTREHYEHCRRKGTTIESGRKREGGFGGLFSLTFTSSDASQKFFDALTCYKGPSLGTNFTLACPYTVLGHYRELEWAEQYGVEEGLVRVSVGLEEREGVLKEFETALKVAEGVM